MNGTIQYTIRPYDTIWMLAQVFNTTVDSIMELNPGIEPRNLMISQVITIRPGYQYYPSYSGSMPGNGQIDGEMDDEMDDEMDEDMGEDMEPGMGQDMRQEMRPGMRQEMRPGMGQDMSPDMGEDMDELTNFFRMLWEQHVAWTRMAVMAIVHELPETEQILQRLLRNPVDFANAMAPFFGEEAAQAFEQLLTSHLTIAAELVRAAKAGDSAAVTAANQRWRENAEQIAALLANMNPYWNEDDWSAMLNEHLDLLTENTTNMIAGNYEESINGFDDVEMQALEMADMMAEGIAMQFPD